MRGLLIANPVSCGVDFTRAAMGQPNPFPAILDVGVQAVFAAAMGAAAVGTFRRAAGQKGLISSYSPGRSPRPPGLH
jgi:hypothetical protein